MTLKFRHPTVHARKWIMWFIYLLAATHVTFRYNLADHNISMFYLFAIIPTGYVIHLVLFEHRER